MPEEISITKKDVIINSLAHDEKYSLSVYKREELLCKNSWPMKSYGRLIKNLWEKCLNDRNMSPSILGYELTNKGFIEETLRYIAPLNFFDDSCSPLDNQREEFIYWLKSKMHLIKKRFESEADYFKMNLDSILFKNLEKYSKS